MAELLLETQMGKNQRLICKLNCNEKLQMFFETLQDDFKPPDIHLTTAVLPYRYGSDSLGGTRKSSRGSRKSSNKKRSRSYTRPYATEQSTKKNKTFENQDVDLIHETELQDPKIFYEGEDEEGSEEDSSINESKKIEPKLSDSN